MLQLLRRLVTAAGLDGAGGTDVSMAATVIDIQANWTVHEAAIPLSQGASSCDMQLPVWTGQTDQAESLIVKYFKTVTRL